MTKTITGTAKFQDISVGFWSIITEDGKELRPVMMPEQLKSEGAKIEFTYDEVEEQASIIMWGTPITITGFTTV